ncbi:MAG: HAMP domain-containing protein [Proteobacteria bacterium]|nr:HAMP domain-containing protein [Pseudomonadota bacterium]
MALALSSLKIRTRLYGGFGLLIVVALALAAFGASRLQTVYDDVGDMAAAADQTNTAAAIVEQVETIRRTALRYYGDGDRGALEQMQTATTEVRRMLKQQTEHAPSQEARSAYRAISDELEAFETKAQAMVAKRDMIEAQRERQMTLGATLAQALARVMDRARASQDPATALTAAELTRAILEMRLSAWRFLATVDASLVPVVQAHHADTIKAMDQLGSMADPEILPLLPPLQAVLRDYPPSFEQLSSAIITNKQLYYEQMVPAIVKLEQHLTNWTSKLSTQFQSARTEAVETASTAGTMQLVVGGLAVLIGMFIAYLIGRSIAAPLAGMTKAMHQLASGNTALSVPSLDAKDEVGDMARAVEVFKANMIKASDLSAEQAKERERKEQRQRAVDGYVTSFDTSVRNMLQSLASASTQMQATAQSMSQTANQTNTEASTMAAAAEQASANVQTMAAATEEMAASAGEISHQVARAAQITAKAVESARHTDQQVQSLSEAAQRIEDVVSIINGIAGQTNLLALNATIEAARAGDAGKGFAVVASEVKALASQTGKATEEIGAQIQAIQQATKEAVDAIRAISATINEVNDISTTIAAAMEEQGATTAQMTRNTQEAAKGTQDVSASIANVSQGANTTGAAATQVLSAAGELGKQAETLRAEVDGFLGKIRAA